MRHQTIFRSGRNSLRLRSYSQRPILESSQKRSSRIDRIISRSPQFLHKHLQSLRTAPVTHISAFLILHELTAVIPLFGLAGTFHYYNWLPTSFAEGAWVVAGVEKFGRYARKKGWISESDEETIKSTDVQEIEQGTWPNRGEGAARWIVEFGTAYAVVKAFMFPRLIVSAWAAPAFARWTVIPLSTMLKKR